jgi:acetyltransferase-like isoleucine patch superfamily enzyme
VLLAPLIYAALFVTVSGTLSLPHQAAIVAGKFPRDVGHPIYFHRRLYGLCWTCLYYNKPVYYLTLTIPLLKRLAFRVFGYRGSMAFTVYPDTWIRDLPLLNFGPGAYIANRATLGTNLALSDGTTMVDRITVGKNTVIGHLVAMAPGCVFGDDVEIGSVTAIGYRSVFGDRADIQPRCSIEHGVRIGADSFIGATSYIGSASKLGIGVVIAPGSVLAPRSRRDAAAPESKLHVVNSERLADHPR